MADISLKYMTVSVDIQPEGLNLMVWMSPAQIWAGGKDIYPHLYNHMGDNCTWIIQSNEELTVKMCSMVAEYADRICDEQKEINRKRKIANR